MRDFGTIIFVLTWSFALVVLVVTGWAVYNWDLFPRKRLRNIPFGDLKIGRTFLDFGGEELKLREYIKTDELEAKCLSVPGHPSVNFDKKDVVKVEVWWNAGR